MKGARALRPLDPLRLLGASRPVGRAFAGVVAAALAWVAFSGGALGDEIVVEGPRTVVHSTVPQKAVAERCRDALEAALPVYEANLRYRMPEKERLVLRLWATADEYAKAVTDGGAGWLTKNLAATLTSTKESHVVLQPRGDAEFLALVGDLPEMTRFLVCHEGVHQFLRRADAPNIDIWPAWYAEGMADALAERCLVAAAVPGTATPVFVDTRRNLVADAVARGTTIRLARLLYVDPASFENRASAYSHWHEWYDFLAQDAARLARLEEAIRALPAPPAPAEGARDDREVAFAASCADALGKTFGPLPPLEDAFRKRSVPGARWFQTSRAAELRGDEIVCASFEASNSVLLSTAARPGGPYSLSVEVNLADVGQRQADVIFGFEDLDDPRWLKLAIGSKGFVTLLAYADGWWQDRYLRNGDVPPGTFEPGQWVPLKILVEKARVRLEVRGKACFEAPLPPGFDALHGNFGFGAAKSVVRFRRIKVEPLPAK